MKLNETLFSYMKYLMLEKQNTYCLCVIFGFHRKVIESWSLNCNFFYLVVVLKCKVIDTVFCRNHGALVKMEPKPQLLYHLLLRVPLVMDMSMPYGYLKKLVSILMGNVWNIDAAIGKYNYVNLIKRMSRKEGSVYKKIKLWNITRL